MSDNLGELSLEISSGKKISVDLHRVTMREYRAIFSGAQTQNDEDATIAKACGLSVEDYLNLPQPDARLVMDAFIRAATQPLRDPNSQSASTSD